MEKIYIIRHAESKSNAGERTLLDSQTPITDKGEFQARKLLERFQKQPDLVVTSSFLRTKRTAHPLLSLYPHAPHEEWNIHEFQYIDRQKAYNTNIDERKEFTDAYWNLCDPFYRDGPEEESFFELLCRAELCKSNLQSQQSKYVTVFTHGNFMRALKIVLPFNKPVSALSHEELVGHMYIFREWRETFPILNTQVFTYDQLLF